ncbi:MAG: hypothetical protein Q8L27_02325 [archaeon]|nr:hypothetical protein [archaeon]
MAQKRIKKASIILENRESGFRSIFSRFRSKNTPEKSEIAMLRSILSPEKSRLLHAVKTNQPNSIYELAKILGRDFKSVRQDILILEDFGIIETIPVHKGNRQKLKPLLVVNEFKIDLKF